MEQIITSFVAALRESGIRVSPGESLDAVQALGLCGMTGRRSTRELLRLTLVKNINDVPTFNEVFNRYFSRFQFVDPEADLPALMDAAITEMEGEFTYLNEVKDDHDDEPGPLIKIDSEINPEDLEELKSLTEIDPDDTDGTEIQVQMKGYRGKAKKPPRPTRRYTQNPLTIELNKSNSYGERITFTPEEQAAMQEVVSKMMLRLRKDQRRMKNNQNRGKLHVIKTIEKIIATIWCRSMWSCAASGARSRDWSFSATSVFPSVTRHVLCCCCCIPCIINCSTSVVSSITGTWRKLPTCSPICRSMI